jgi:hypothetical protein
MTMLGKRMWSLPNSPFMMVQGKVTVAERVSYLRRTAALARQEADVLEAGPHSCRNLHRIARLRRQARLKEGEADRMLQEGSSPEKLNEIIHIRMTVRK